MKRSSIALFTAALAASIALACVPINEDLGKDLISTKARFNVFTEEYPLTGLETRMAEDLSGFSNSRIVIGAVRDADYGVSKRSSAFTLVPAIDTLDFGENPEAVRFYIHLACDTTCVVPGGQYNLQNLSVYALKDTIDFVDNGTNKVPEVLPGKVCVGSPVINGKDSLKIEFTKEFGQKYIDGILSLFDKDGDGKAVLSSRGDEYASSNREAFTEYNKLLPGVLVEADEPVGNGGRFDMFRLSCFSIAYDSGSSAYYYRNNNVGILRVRGTFKGVRRDTAYLFLPGELEFLDENSYLENRTKFYQYAFNATVQDPVTESLIDSEEKVYVEGGGGMKPVVSADSLGRILYEDIASKGGDPSYTVINRGTLLLPFDDPGPANNYSEFDLFPTVLSPTCRIVTTVKDEDAGTEREVKTFAALADASSSAENQGDINRSLCRYNPDITHHLQQILKVYIEKVKKYDEASEADREAVLEEYRKKLSNYDIWFLNVHDETVETLSASSYDNDYYRNLMYAQYYNSLYGGYGGYGGYGYGYGYGYGDYGGYGYGSNYYSLAMLNALYSGSGTTTTTTQELDTARFYKAVLNGPATASDSKPSLVVTYSFPKE